MEWNTDFEVSTTVIMAIFEVKSNVSEFYDLNCKPDGGATGITGISTFGHVPIGECRIGLNVDDGTGLYNTTRKQILVTDARNVAAGANGIAGSIWLHEGGGWMVFNRTNSTAYLDTGQVNVSWTWGINDMPICSGLGSFSWIIDRDTTETLTVVAGNVSEGLTVPSYRAASPLGAIYRFWHQSAWLHSPGMLCIASRGQDRKKRWEVMSSHYELCGHTLNML